MKIYLLNIKTYDYTDDTENEYVEIFSNFERAKKYGLEFLNKELQLYCKYLDCSIDEALESEKIDYDFRIVEEDLEYDGNVEENSPIDVLRKILSLKIK